MMQFLVAFLLTVAFGSMEPMTGAADPAMPAAAAMTGNASPAMGDDAMCQCAQAHPCVQGCPACVAMPASKARNVPSGIPVSGTGATTLAGFDLAWRLYRPPKDPPANPDFQRPTQHKGTQDA